MMQLKDFYYADKHEAGSKMPIILPGGEDSGEFLIVRGPDCDMSIAAGRAYTAAIRTLDDKLSTLEAKCKAKDDYTEWNEQRGWAIEPLNKQLAVALVSGWTLTHDDGTPESFSQEALLNLLNQVRGLAEQVSAHHVKSREALNAKL